MLRFLLLPFVAQFVALDLALRGPVALFIDPTLLASALASVLFWALAVSAASSTPGRVLVALAASTDLVVQCAFYRYYHAPIDFQVVTALFQSWGDVKPVLVQGLAKGLAAICLVAALEYAFLRSFAESFRWRRPLSVGLLALLLGATAFGPGRAAARELSRSRAKIASSVHLGVMPSSRKKLPSILFLLTESVRARDYCSARSADCRVAPEVNALVPERLPLREMRSVSSYTAISVAAILSGRVPDGPRDAVAQTPLLFDYLKSLRHPSGSFSVAYWSAQTDSLFERSDLAKTLDSFVTVRDLVGRPVGDEDEIIDEGVDRLLAARVATETAKIEPPFAAVVHFQGTHAPYFVDAADAPFEPFDQVVTWSGLSELHNAYLDAVHEQDKSVAKTIRAFLDRVGGEPYVIFFTSDHGESFGEHGAIHHGQNLFEEQIHVPAWVAAGNGALDAQEISALRAYERVLVTHLDILPTLLDIVGMFGPGTAPLAGVSGRSLIAPIKALSLPVALTNCTEMFRCPLNTWGLLDERGELTAQPWDADWRCVDLAGLPLTAGDGRCEALRSASAKFFRTQPNGAPNRR